MAIPFTAAASAYSNAAKLINQGGLLPASNVSTVAPQGTDFAKMLSDTVQSVVDTGKASDKKALDLVNGKADVVDVVTSVSQTQIAVEGMVAVRDRVITAYEEIMRMPI
jgi:flagellar hook-basal body complex protein FliE